MSKKTKIKTPSKKDLIDLCIYLDNHILCLESEIKTMKNMLKKYIRSDIENEQVNKTVSYV